MNRMLTLKSYDDWKHCITVLCCIPLTQAYVEQRLAALRDPADRHTQKFFARIRSAGMLACSSSAATAEHPSSWKTGGLSA